MLLVLVLVLVLVLLLLRNDDLGVTARLDPSLSLLSLLSLSLGLCLNFRLNLPFVALDLDDLLLLV